MTTNAWKVAAFAVATDDGEVQVAGWVNGLFALDFRVFDLTTDFFDRPALRHGWAMTHIPTGRLTAGLIAPLAPAKSMAGWIAALGDWNFVEAEQAREFAAKIQELVAEYPGKLMLKSASFSPLFFSADPAEVTA